MRSLRNGIRPPDRYRRIRLIRLLIRLLTPFRVRHPVRMTSYTASTHVTVPVRAAAAALGTQFLLPLCLKREVTGRPECTLGDPRLQENSA